MGVLGLAVFNSIQSKQSLCHEKPTLFWGFGFGWKSGKPLPVTVLAVRDSHLK
jgi:hypothetical protein